MCFSTKFGRHFLKANNAGGHFCPDFQRFCPDFQGFCSDFRQIKTFGGALSPQSPASLNDVPLCEIILGHYRVASLTWFDLFHHPVRKLSR